MLRQKIKSDDRPGHSSGWRHLRKLDAGHPISAWKLYGDWTYLSGRTTEVGGNAVANIFEMDPDTRCWFRNSAQQEVSARNSQENPAPAKNSLGRILLEMSVTLAIAGILVATAAYFAPALS
jgi:hypothetical protein